MSENELENEPNISPTNVEARVSYLYHLGTQSHKIVTMRAPAGSGIINR